MSLSKQASKATKTYERVFPNSRSCHKVAALSMTHMKTILDSCISSILSYRKIFPEEDFEKIALENMTIRRLKDVEGKSEHSDNILKMLKGAHDAMEKNWLNRLFFEISDDNGLTLEMYIFQFAYKENMISIEMEMDGVRSPQSSTPRSQFAIRFSEVQQTTVDLLRNCIVIAMEAQPLPLFVNLGIKLEYNGKVGKGYQAPGYEACKPHHFKFGGEPQGLRVGAVATNLHRISLNFRSTLFNLPPVEELSESPMQATPMLLTPVEQIRQWPPAQDAFVAKKKRLSGYGYELFESEDDFEFSCLCQTSNPLLTKIQCKVCFKYSHADCFGFLGVQPSGEFICHLCHDPDAGFYCHDQLIFNVDSKRQQEMAVLRRLVSLCLYWDEEEITFSQLIGAISDVNDDMIQSAALKILYQSPILSHSNEDGTYQLQKKHMPQVLQAICYEVQHPNGTVMECPLAKATMGEHQSDEADRREL